MVGAHLAAGFTLAAIAGLVVFAGRVYTGAILHTGSTLKLRDAWRGTPGTRPDRGGERRASHRRIAEKGSRGDWA